MKINELEEKFKAFKTKMASLELNDRPHLLQIEDFMSCTKTCSNFYYIRAVFAEYFKYCKFSKSEKIFEICLFLIDEYFLRFKFISHESYSTYNDLMSQTVLEKILEDCGVLASASEDCFRNRLPDDLTADNFTTKKANLQFKRVRMYCVQDLIYDNNLQLSDLSFGPLLLQYSRLSSIVENTQTAADYERVFLEEISHVIQGLMKKAIFCKNECYEREKTCISARMKNRKRNARDEYIKREYEEIKSKNDALSRSSIAFNIAQRIQKLPEDGGLPNWESYFYNGPNDKPYVLSSKICDILRQMGLS